jgi:hypothetical protein
MDGLNSLDYSTNEKTEKSDLSQICFTDGEDKSNNQKMGQLQKLI